MKTLSFHLSFIQVISAALKIGLFRISQQIKKVMEGGNFFIFLLPGIEKKVCFGFQVVNKVMRKGGRFFHRLPDQKVTNNNM